MKNVLFIISMMLALCLTVTELCAQGAGYALQFDGVDDYVDLGNPDSLQFTDSITVELWMKIPSGTDISNSPAMISKWLGYPGNDGGSWHFFTHSSSGVSWEIQRSNNGIFGVSCFQPLNDGQWHHVAVRYDGINTQKIFVDGVEQGTVTSEFGSFGTSTRSIRIGGTHASGRFFKGEIDDVRIWHQALPEETISFWKDKPISALHPDYTKLMGYWKFDEGNGDTTKDHTGFGSTGTLLNGTTWIQSTTPFTTSSFLVSPTEINFGHTQVGLSVTDTIRINNLNQSGQNIILSIIGDENNVFSTDSSSLTLAPNEIRSFAVHFTQQAQQYYTAQLLLSSANDSNTIPLSGGGNWALSFDGDDEVVIPHSSSISFSDSSEFTMEMWFMPTQDLPTYHLLGKRTNCGHDLLNYQIAKDPPSLLAFLSDGEVVSTLHSPPINQWSYIGITYGNSLLRMYVNDSLMVTTPYTMTGENTVSLKFGNTGDACPVYQRFLGLMDEVRIWNIERTQKQMKNYYNREVLPNTPGLVGYWNFDEDSTNQTVRDVSNHGNDGWLGNTQLLGGDDPHRVVSTAPVYSLSHDAALLRILQPDTVVMKDSVYTPQLLVKNFGIGTDTIEVHLKMGNFYDESGTIILSSLDSGIVNLPDWIPTMYGYFPMLAYTVLPEDLDTFNDSIKSNVAVVSGGAGPAIYSVSPNTGGNSGTISVTIHGKGFQDSALVKLVRDGYQDIEGFNTTVVDTGTITTQFDLTGRQLGDWDVVVMNQDGQSTSLPNSFTVNEGIVNLWAEIIGRKQIRVGREARYLISYGNSGNVQAPVALLSIQIWATSSSSKRQSQIQGVLLAEGPLFSQVILLPSIGQEIPLPISFPISIPTLGCFQIEALIEPLNQEPTDTCELIMQQIRLFRNRVDWAEQNQDECQDPICVEKWEKILNKYKYMLRLLCGEWSSRDCGVTPPAECASNMTLHEENNFLLWSSDAGFDRRKSFDLDQDVNSSSKEVCSIASWDPNEKVGPVGYGPDSIVTLSNPLAYSIYFENKDSATAAAQEVEIKDTLDTDLDWNSFSFSDMQIGDTLISLPDVGQSLNLTYQLNDTVDVDITGSFNPSEGIIRWYMKGRDRRDGELADFLPPNDSSVVPKGEGWVSYSVNPKLNLTTGTRITNRASIVFDVNSPILTNEVLNTIDAGDPSSRIISLSGMRDSSYIKVTWSGEDDSSGSGIHSYTLYAEPNKEAFQASQSNITDTAINIPVEVGTTYRFFTSARDNVGNIESWKVITNSNVAAVYQVTSRWNMVSLPLDITNTQKTSLFPTAVSSAFRFDGSNGYQQSGTLVSGVGYWIKFEQDEFVLLQGFPQSSDTINVTAGWNMIGGITSQLPVTDITSNPPGIVTSQFFGYEDGYVVSDSIQPGKAYWVKVNQNGTLVLSSATSGIFSSNRIKIVPSKELPPPPPDEIDAVNTMPKEFALEQNYPNPFNPVTVIRYALPAVGRQGLSTYKVQLKIYNVLGQQVATIVDDVQAAGYKTKEWNAGNFASGVYFYRITVQNQDGKRWSDLKKMLLLR